MKTNTILMIAAIVATVYILNGVTTKKSTKSCGCGK